MFHECESNIINSLLMMALWPNRQDKVHVSLACPAHFKLLKNNSLLSPFYADFRFDDYGHSVSMPNAINMMDLS